MHVFKKRNLYKKWPLDEYNINLVIVACVKNPINFKFWIDFCHFGIEIEFFFNKFPFASCNAAGGSKLAW